jgi:peptidoglycan/xylan/chitin deacetylase (PgdA/CDA1 family)
MTGPRDRARWRVGACLLGAAVLWACGDAAGPDIDVSGIAAPDMVHVDAIPDSVRLAAELVYRSGDQEALAGGEWSGDNDAVAIVHPDGWVHAVAEGEVTATVRYDRFETSTRVVVQRAGRILLTFDDGWRTVHTVALPALADADLVASVAVIIESVGWPAFVDRDQLQDLHDAGWAAVSHSLTHAQLPTLTDQELEAELADSRQWLLDQGLRTGDAFIVPYHDWGDRERDAVRRHYAAARGATTDATYPEFVARWRPDDPYTVTSVDASALLRTPDGRAEILHRVEEAIQEGLLLDLMFHDIPPDDAQAFQALVDALAPYRDRVFTWADIAPVPAQ